jgi:AcrR family transcriptional regulator
VGAEERIRAAAAEEFMAHGASGFRVTSVARAAGCATSVLYHHFGSRDGLLAVAAVQCLERATSAEDERRGALVARARGARSLESVLLALASAENDERTSLARCYASASSEVASAQRSLDESRESTAREVATALISRGLADDRDGGVLLALVVRLLLSTPSAVVPSEVTAAASALAPRGGHLDDARAD